tara:strand:- start:42 stop:878 length:837 start_codon:yes stop_codon:yes gene_type:complete
MILTEAYELMDLLLDKADQPYFTTEEKNKFLNLAISDFINMHYQKMTADEDSRRALSAVIDWNQFGLTKTEIASDLFVYDSAYPALSQKFTQNGISDGASPPAYTGTHSTGSESTTVGYFKFGNQYVLPEQHLYVLSMAVSYYNIEEVIDSSDGKLWADSAEADIVFHPASSAKNKSTRDFYEDEYNNDPFNVATKSSPVWSYIENRINIEPSDGIRYINIQTITLPTAEQAFAPSNFYTSGVPNTLRFSDHYQKQIIDLAVNKMIKVDIGLVRPSSR